MNTTTEFTPECVRDTLTAAGYAARDKDAMIPGFNMGDGRESRGEIIVEFLSGHLYKEPGDDDRRRSFEEAYEAALARAGFRVYIESRYVIVTGLEGDR